MKKPLLMLFMACSLFFGLVATGCQTTEKKVDEAKEDVKDAKQDLNEAQQKANEEAQKAAMEADWTQFKQDVKAKIDQNDARITELRKELKKPGKALDDVYATRIDILEQKNKDLKARIDVYENHHSDWDTFKREFNHDMDELGMALKDFTVNNKK